jgi:hypothetical protein
MNEFSAHMSDREVHNCDYHRRDDGQSQSNTGSGICVVLWIWI